MFVLIDDDQGKDVLGVFNERDDLTEAALFLAGEIGGYAGFELQEWEVGGQLLGIEALAVETDGAGLVVLSS